mgnify:FL=1
MAGWPEMTVALAEAAPLTVRENWPLGEPVPVRGRVVGEEGSELVTVRVPVRWPRTAGVKVMTTAQLAPGASAVVLQGVVMA